MPHPKNSASIILFLALLQVLCSTYFLYIPGFYAINSFLFLFSGIGIVFFLLQLPTTRLGVHQLVNRQLFLKLVSLAILLPLSYQLARHIMDQNPLHVESADMLPIMKKMGQRFWDGQWKMVYQPIPEIWNGIQPIYLPAMWMPFSLSLVFHFDMRWITLCGIWLSVIICILPPWKVAWQNILLVVAILTLLTWLHTDSVNNVIRLTEEGAVFFYYTLLAVAIISFNPWLLGIGSALCLLSRYSFIGWIPFALLFLVETKQYLFLLKTTAAAALIFLLILILPFGIDPLLYHLHLQHDYISQATMVWRQNPEFYYQSLGMAKFFGSNRITILHSVLIAGTFISPIIFFFLVRKKSLAPSIVLLAGLQLSITFFYNFLDITYLYLFYTPVFVSLVIASWCLYAQSLEN